MKSAICQTLLFAALFGCLQLSLATNNADALVKKVAEECIKETGVTAAESKLILADELEKIDEKDFTDKMKCFLLCFYKKVGILTAEGKPVTEHLLTFMEERYSKNKDKVKPALAKCGKLTDTNACEAVYKFEICMAKTVG